MLYGCCVNMLPKLPEEVEYSHKKRTNVPFAAILFNSFML
jgi:hypothetical protein